MARRRASLTITLWRVIRRFVLTVITGFIVVSIAGTFVFRWYDPPGSAFMWRAVFQGKEVVHQWRQWGQISQHLAIAVIAAEDQRFPDHNGFDLTEIQNALSDSLQGDRLRGASTITQQVAKNLFLWRQRSFTRKVLEAWFTVCIELLWSKRRILEVYLNTAEFGPDVYGAQAASALYFGRSAGEIDRKHAALMAAVLPNPHRLSLQQPSLHVLRRARQISSAVEKLGGTAYLARLGE